MSFLGKILPRSWVTAKAAGAAELGPIVVPQARDRWMGPMAASYTPERVEMTLRGSMNGDLRAQHDLFELMEETWPRLAKNLGQLKDTVIGSDWSVQPWTGDTDQVTPEGKKRADLVERLMWTMQPRADYDENGWEDTVRDLLDARSKGISVLEIDWERRVTEVGQAVAPRCTRWVHPRFYGYPMDGEDRLMLRAGEVRRSNTESALGRDEWVPFPPDKFVLGVCKAKTGHPLRGALLRSLGFWWVASNFSGEWLLNFSQLFGQPIRWATYDRGLSATDKSKLAEMLETMGSAAWAMFPAGTVLELKEAMKSGTDNPQMAVLTTADKVCDVLILRQTLTTDVGDSGSRALGDVHQDVLGSVEQALGNWAARVLTEQLVKPICRLNFGDDRECPSLMTGGKEESEDPKMAAERDAILMQNQVPLPKEWFYTRHKVPMPGPEDEVITGPAPAPAMPFGQPGGGGGGLADLFARGPIHARAGSEATDQLVDNVLEDLTGVKARWLAGVKPYFAHLVDLARDEKVSDAELVRALEALSRQLPELAGKLDAGAVQVALEKAMGTALVNGAVHGHLIRNAEVRRKNAEVRAKGAVARTKKQLKIERNDRGTMTGITIE